MVSFVISWIPPIICAIQVTCSEQDLLTISMYVLDPARNDSISIRAECRRPRERMRDRRNPAVRGLAMDTNVDGKPDDVDGDGRIDVADVVRLFNRLCRRRRYHGAPSSGPWTQGARPLDLDRDLEPPEVGPHHTGRPWPFASLILFPSRALPRRGLPWDRRQVGDWRVRLDHPCEVVAPSGSSSRRSAD
jgi:hypothetical protein